MLRSSNPTTSTLIRGGAWIAFAVLMVGAAPSVDAQSYCQDWTDVLLDTTSSCVSSPARERAFQAETFSLNGGEYLILNRGNEFQIYDVAEPYTTDPRSVESSHFNFGTAGDSDYDLVDLDVADGSRYGVLDHKVAGVVVFDLGTGVPQIKDFGKHGAFARGSIVFTKGGQEYLIARGIDSQCGSDTGVYAINNVDSLTLLQCIEIDGSSFRGSGGQTVTTSSGTYVYLGGGLPATTHIFKAEGTGLGLELIHTSTRDKIFSRLDELAIEEHHKLAASADFNGRVVTFWDLSDPGNPVEKTSWALDATAASVALRSASASSPLVMWISAAGFLNRTRTYLIDPVTGPEPIDNEYWTDLSEPFNDFQDCTADMAGALSEDGSALYLSRYSTHQVFDLSQCMGPVAATAGISLTPSTAADPNVGVVPGTTVTVTDKTFGSYDRWAIWIEKNGVFETGNQTPSASNPHTLNFTVPKNVGETTVYTANIAIESSDLIPEVSEAWDEIEIDRTPQASFTITPDAAIVGDTVTLAATAEGHPSATDPYVWTIDPPLTGPITRTGTSTQVTLDQSGQWEFTLTVNYDHAASGTADPDDDSKYEDVVTEVFNVGSVAADFTISPTPPLNNDVITLNGSGSKGTISSYEWSVYGPTNRAGDDIQPSYYDGCPAAAVCTIPANALEWGAYTIKLIVTGANDESDDKQVVVTVANGAIQPVFSWSPSSPEIGDLVTFNVGGVDVPISKATWNMGGTGCDGASATQTCTPALFQTCKALAFKYASGGSKVVSLSVVVDGVTYTDERPASERTVSVASTGSCGGGTGPTCTYSLSDDGAQFGPAGGDGAFTVFTSTGCAWTASESLSWVRITSGTSHTGTGAVRFTVDPNTGPARSGYLQAGGKLFTIVQEPPYVPANFTMSKVFLERGEPVTFTVDPVLEVSSWNFGEADCRGSSPVINCAFLPAGACNNVEWQFPTAGEKQVTMVLLDGRQQTKGPTVRAVGECCTKDSRPSASFTYSNDEPVVGERVVFTDASTKSSAAKALGFDWNPSEPTIGENTVFTLSGLNGDVTRATWNFGGAGCNGAPAEQVCSPGLFNDCKAMAFSYASGGAKSVSVEVELQGGGTQTAGPASITVLNSGSCDGGGGVPTCSYALSPTSADFDEIGGAGQFAVTTTADCAWSAATTSSWLHIGQGGGTGGGTVTYTVDENQGTSARTGYIRVEGRSHTVRQSAPVVEVDSAPTDWLWTVSRVLEGGGLEMVDTSPEQHFTYTFSEPGTYRVSLSASNCMGSSEYWKTFTVTEAPVEDFVVGAAVRLAGANDTHWETDLRFHNPCEDQLDVRIEYEPEGTNNTDANLVFREFQLAPNETRLFADITEAIPGLIGEELSGSVRIESSSASGCKVLSVSRTFNNTPYGSLGLFVPALPVKRSQTEFLDLTGLLRNADYRTNVRLVNYGDEDVWVPISIYDTIGNEISNPREALVYAHSTRQINDIAGWLGVQGDLGPFSVRANVTDHEVQAFATVVDNLTGDSVAFLSSFDAENRVWVVGVASTAGVNDSQWRTDVWLYNPTEEWLQGQVEFVVGTSPADVYGFEWPDLKPHRVRDYLDIVGQEFNLEETSGYLVLTGADGGPAPQVAARTYNLDLGGGTYGLNLRTFTGDDLLMPGETGFIVGISNSADQSVGFRTNLGLLNTDRERWTGVRLTLIDVSGVAVGEPLEMLIAPGALRQFDVAQRFGVANVTGSASLKVEVTEGGGVAAYATEIDNRTQDSIFIPAQRRVQGAPQ